MASKILLYAPLLEVALTVPFPGPVTETASVASFTSLRSAPVLQSWASITDESSGTRTSRVPTMWTSCDAVAGVTGQGRGLLTWVGRSPPGAGAPPATRPGRRVARAVTPSLQVPENTEPRSGNGRASEGGQLERTERKLP